jgi:hypothetical protein
MWVATVHSRDRPEPLDTEHGGWRTSFARTMIVRLHFTRTSSSSVVVVVVVMMTAMTGFFVFLSRSKHAKAAVLLELPQLRLRHRVPREIQRALLDAAAAAATATAAAAATAPAATAAAAATPSSASARPRSTAASAAAPALRRLLLFELQGVKQYLCHVVQFSLGFVVVVILYSRSGR